MSWLFSRALVGASLGVISSDGDASAPLNSTPTPQAYFWPGRTTDACPRFPSGMTCEHLTDDRGEAVLMWCLEDSLVRTFQQPERAQESPESEADSGARWRGLSVKWDRASSGWRTHQCLFPEALPWPSVTLPRWGMMRDGELWERITPAPLTSETEYGYWATPQARDHRTGEGHRFEDPNRSRNLNDQVANPKFWPTPRNNTGPRKDPRHLSLDGAVKLWPTLTVHGNHNRKGLSAKSGDGLATAVKTWPTPTATQHKGWSPGHNRADTDDRLDYTVEREAHQAGTGGQLNPPWVEWLMGWPIGFTDLKPLATDRFRTAWLLPGMSYVKGLNNGILKP
jgi:hypothetical protein